MDPSRRRGRPADTAQSPEPSPVSGPATTPAEPLAAALVAAVAGLYGKAEMDGFPTTEISTGNTLRAARTELENAVATTPIGQTPPRSEDALMVDLCSTRC